MHRRLRTVPGVHWGLTTSRVSRSAVVTAETSILRMYADIRYVRTVHRNCLARRVQLYASRVLGCVFHDAHVSFVRTTGYLYRRSYQLSVASSTSASPAAPSASSATSSKTTAATVEKKISSLVLGMYSLFSEKFSTFKNIYANLIGK